MPPAPAAAGGQQEEDDGVTEQVSKDVFSKYRCQSIERGIEHPGDIAEPSSLRCAQCFAVQGLMQACAASSTFVACCAVRCNTGSPACLQLPLMQTLSAGVHSRMCPHSSFQRADTGCTADLAALCQGTPCTRLRNALVWRRAEF